MTLGRPTLSSIKSTAILPGTLDEEISSPGNDPTSSDVAVAPSTAAFFTQTTKLYKILDNILSKVYDPWKETEAGGPNDANESLDDSPQLACIITLDAQLDNFETTVPEILQWRSHDEEGDENGILQRQRNVLRTR